MTREQDEDNIKELQEQFKDLDMTLEGMVNNINVYNIEQKIANLNVISKKVIAISDRWLEIRDNGVLDVITIEETNLVLVLINLKIVELALVYAKTSIYGKIIDSESPNNNTFNFSLN